MMQEISFGQNLTVYYKNHKGEEGERKLQPIALWYGTSSFHQEEGDQWFLRSWCFDRRAYRDFAIKDMKLLSVTGSVSGIPERSPR